MSAGRRSSSRRALALWLGALAALAGCARPSAAAAPYPSRPVHLIVSFAAGGPMDSLARILAVHLGPALGQPVVVENRVGAAGNIGLEYLAKAPPDGHVLGLVGAVAVTAAIAAPGKAVDPQRAFVPVAKLVTQPLLIVTAAGVPARDLGELVELARSEPDRLSYSTQGIATPPHVAALLLMRRAGISMQHIPYSGTAQTYKDVLAGDVPVTISFVNLLKPFVQSGQLRAMAVTGARRSAALPDVPTVAESGYPGYDVGSWLGLVAPAGTHPDVAQRLAAELRRILELPEVRGQLAGLGMEPAYAWPEEFAAAIRADAQAWEPVIGALAPPER